MPRGGRRRGEVCAGLARAIVARVTEFLGQDLSNARFEDVRMVGATFHNLTLRDATFHWVDLSNIRIRSALLDGAEINADFGRLVVNGVDVAPLIEAELDRRHPGRAQMRAEGVEGYRASWELLRSLWDATIERARQLPEERLHESVGGEWSFIETLRHLLFVVEAWVLRAVLGDPAPWHPLTLPFDEMADTPGVPRDRTVRPSLDEVVEALADRHRVAGEVFHQLTEERLAERTTPVAEPGWPESTSFVVGECLRVVLLEEFEHRLFAERDLHSLTAALE